MADYAIASDSSQMVVETLNPDQPLVGALTITKDSGPSDFSNTSDKPNEIKYISGSVAGVTVFRYTGTDAGGASVTDVVTYTVTDAPPPPPPPLTSLGATFAAPVPKA